MKKAVWLGSAVILLSIFGWLYKKVIVGQTYVAGFDENWCPISVTIECPNSGPIAHVRGELGSDMAAFEKVETEMDGSVLLVRVFQRLNWRSSYSPKDFDVRTRIGNLVPSAAFYVNARGRVPVRLWLSPDCPGAG